MSEIIEIIIRAIVAFLWLWLFTVLVGKQLISHNTYHLFVLSSILGTISGNMAFNIKIPFMYFLLSLFVTSGIGYIMMLISLKHKKARKWISGDPVTLIKDGNIMEQNMQKSNFTLDSLKQGLRNKNIFDLKEVELAILEIDGSLSVLPKTEYRNLTQKDYFLIQDPKIPVDLIIEGKVIERNLYQKQLSKEWLFNELSERDLQLTDVYNAVLSTNGKLFFDLKK